MPFYPSHSHPQFMKSSYTKYSSPPYPMKHLVNIAPQPQIAPPQLQLPTNQVPSRPTKLPTQTIK